ncbi:glycosyltransferase family 2 protein [Mumia zhuanghuii]|uniref:glycosyltransferase family 2 protein n=1 Tax=Mumia zhuanghuii TaxID=2585211 RepID=UPI00363DA3C5
MSIDVSVVVASYNTGPKLAPLLDSLTAQSLPPDRFEIVIVDDGSTDDTWERLVEAARHLKNLQIERIPNSGWPGRPRNVGMDLARGRYVFFADHDDELFPEALERMVAVADRATADVVVGKEVRAGAATIGAEAFLADHDRAGLFDDHVLAIITPHKLFRTSFLREHGIRFPEGRRRLEDHVFLAHVYSLTDRVAVLASYPCYRWVIYPDGSNNSDSLGDLDVYFHSLAEVLDVLEQAPIERSKRARLVQFWYSTRMLKRLGPYWFDQWTPEYRDEAIRIIGDLAAKRIPAALDDGLEPVLARRAALLRAGDADGLVALADVDRGVHLRVDDAEVIWSGGRLGLAVTGTLADATGSALALVAGGEALYLPDDVDRRHDVVPFLSDADVELYVRQATVGTEWSVPGRLRLQPTERDGVTELVTSGTLWLDPGTAALGSPLAPGRWTMLLRTRALGYSSRRRLEAPAPPPALVDGLAVRPVNDEQGRLALFIGATRRLLDDVAGTVAVSGRGHHLTVSVDLPHLHLRDPDAAALSIVVGGTEVPASLDVTGKVPSVRAVAATVSGRLPVRLGLDGVSSTALATAYVRRPWQRIRTRPGLLSRSLRRLLKPAA